ncbi:unnamed protein product, partial [Ectocarpus sp. 4 AP-2014]
SSHASKQTWFRGAGKTHNKRGWITSVPPAWSTSTSQGTTLRSSPLSASGPRLRPGTTAETPPASTATTGASLSQRSWTRLTTGSCKWEGCGSRCKNYTLMRGETWSCSSTRTFLRTQLKARATTWTSSLAGTFLGWAPRRTCSSTKTSMTTFSKAPGRV